MNSSSLLLTVNDHLVFPDFCKKIQEKTERRMVEGHESDSDLEDLIRGSDDEDAPFIHHPFKVTEKSEIVMNIRVC